MLSGPACFLCYDFCHVEQVEAVHADREETFLQKTSHGVAWDFVRFDIDGKKDTISVVKQQNSHKEITT